MSKSRTLIRIALAAAALAIALLATRATIANVLAPRQPSLAITIDSGNALAAAGAAQARVEADGAAVASPAVRALTNATLRRDVTIPTAIEIKALDLQLNGDAAAAAALINSSRAISRRSLGTHLWLIQHWVAAGNVSRALNEYDLALRTSSNAPRLLFPVLARATADPSMQAPIAAVLDRPTEWRAMFLDYAIKRSGSVETVAPIVLHMRDLQMAAAVRHDLVETLAKRDAFSLARRVDDRFAGSRVLMRDVHFADPNARSPFGWALSESSTSWAIRDRLGSRPVLSFGASPGASGELANQLLTLEPGAYVLRTATATGPRDAGALPYWTVSCAGNSAGLAHLDVGPVSGQVTQTRFDVLAKCSGQWLQLMLRESTVAGGQSGSIAAVEIRRL